MSGNSSNEIQRQKGFLADQLWQFSNIITGYSIVQAFAILITLASNNGKYILYASWCVSAGIVVIGMVITVIIIICTKREIFLRKELEADESIISTARMATTIRLFLVISIHLLTAILIIVYKFHKLSQSS